MHTPARSLVLLVAFVMVWTSLVSPERVLAQDNTQVVIVPITASPEAGGVQPPFVVTNDATSTPLDPAMVLALVLVLLLVALFALSEIFRYLRDGREDYYKTFREFARKGVYLEPVMVNATASQSRVMDMGGGAEATQASDFFEMSGPGLLATGDKGTYSASLNSAPAAGTVWQLKGPGNTAVPTQDATLEVAPDGASATLTAAKAGSYIVGASPTGNANFQASAAVTVIDPPAGDGATPTLPFIGEGYGAIVGAILLLAVVVVLAATRAIDADTIGVLLGSIAGYLFGVGVSRSTS